MSSSFQRFTARLVIIDPIMAVLGNGEQAPALPYIIASDKEAGDERPYIVWGERESRSLGASITSSQPITNT